MTTTPSHKTAKLIRAYAQSRIDDPDEVPPILSAILTTYDTEAVCHMGRALLCIQHGLSDPPFRLGGAMCDPRITEIAARLGWTA